MVCTLHDSRRGMVLPEAGCWRSQRRHAAAFLRCPVQLALLQGFRVILGRGFRLRGSPCTLWCNLLPRLLMDSTCPALPERQLHPKKRAAARNEAATSNGPATGPKNPAPHPAALNPRPSTLSPFPHTYGRASTRSPRPESPEWWYNSETLHPQPRSAEILEP